MDDHFDFWNWLKYIGIGKTLLRKYKAAVAERNVQVEGHRGLTDVLEPRVVEGWERMCTEWEQDAAFPKKKKNPYYVEDGRTCFHSLLVAFLDTDAAGPQLFLKSRSRNNWLRKKRNA